MNLILGLAVREAHYMQIRFSRSDYCVCVFEHAHMYSCLVGANKTNDLDIILIIVARANYAAMVAKYDGMKS